MKRRLSQNRNTILFALIFCIFVIQVLVVPSIRPFFYEGRNYYVTYRIDGCNIADAVVFIPLAFMAMGFFTTLLRYPNRIRAVLLCALIPLPVVLRRMVSWQAYSSVLDNALYNICLFAVGVLLAVFLRFVTVRVVSLIRNSLMRYREKKNGQQVAVSSDTDSAAASPKLRLRDRICAAVTHDTVLCLLSAAIPLMAAILYSASIAQTSSVGIAQDETDMTYMLFGLPIAYLLSGLLCAAADKPRYFSCSAALVLISLDTVYAVLDIQVYEDLKKILIAALVYLLFFGVGIVIGRLIRRCIDGHRAIKQRRKTSDNNGSGGI